MRNERWHPENLVETYGIQGGPFSPAGYRWQAAVRIPREGFYRLNLGETAGLDDNPSGIRLVREDMQTPYFWGRPRPASIELFPEIEYDRKENRTVWTLTLPRASRWWTGLRLEASGIFERTVKAEVPKAGPRSWRAWRTLRWRGLSGSPSILDIDMRGFPKDATALRIVMNHGDNRPLEIASVKIRYDEKAVMFIATAPGPLRVFGGNPEAPAGNYDIELARPHLAGTKPSTLTLEKIEPLRRSGWKAGLEKMFGEKGWGLYSALIAVSLVLVVIVVRLFPKSPGGPPRD
jgi:hypothetical protein